MKSLEAISLGLVKGLMRSAGIQVFSSPRRCLMPRPAPAGLFPKQPLSLEVGNVVKLYNFAKCWLWIRVRAPQQAQSPNPKFNWTPHEKKTMAFEPCWNFHLTPFLSFLLKVASSNLPFSSAQLYVLNTLRKKAARAESSWTYQRAFGHQSSAHKCSAVSSPAYWCPPSRAPSSPRSPRETG